MTYPFKLLQFIFLWFSLVSCDWLQQKTHHQWVKAKRYADHSVDKIFPQYDAERPDTEHNKHRFQQHLQIEPTNDVENIYCQGDFMGIDYYVRIAFTCNPSTADRIIQNRDFILTNTNDTTDTDCFESISVPYWWYECKDRKNLKKYEWKENSLQYREFFYYNSITRQAYYLEIKL